MSQNLVNLALRFMLELIALGAYAFWGWTTHEGSERIIWAVGLPLLAAALWGTFRVPGDPGNAPVAVPGAVRLALEVAYFGVATLSLAWAGQAPLALGFGAVVLVHYVVSYDRIGRLVAR